MLQTNDEVATHYAELGFVTGGRVKFAQAVKILPENNAISQIICVELQDLHTPSVILY